jgi:hypothetical protein
MLRVERPDVPAVERVANNRAGCLGWLPFRATARRLGLGKAGAAAKTCCTPSKIACGIVACGTVGGIAHRA